MASDPRSTPARSNPQVDLLLPVLLLAAGGVAMAYGSRFPTAFVFSLSMDATLVVGCVGLLLALAEGVTFRRALLLLVPVVAVQVFEVGPRTRPFVGGIGIELFIFGAVGLLLALRAGHAAAPRRASSGRRHLPAELMHAPAAE